VEISDTGAPFDVAFDPNGATPDSMYTAQLVLTGSDEILPGGQPSVPLTVDLSATVYSGPLAVGGGPARPARTQLYTPFPSPLAMASSVRFDLARGDRVRLDVLDLAGRRVATLADRAFEPGRYALRWTGRDAGGAPVAAGLYFVRMSTG